MSALRIKLGKWSKVFTILAVAALTSVGLVIGGQYYWSQSQSAKASGLVELYPGQSGRFTVKYCNGGDTDTMKNAILKVYIGSATDLDVNSVTDQFYGSTTQYPVSSTLTRTSTTWGWVIEYRPGTATSASTPSGSGVKGDVVIPPAGCGYLRFTAKLKTDILTIARPNYSRNYQTGDLLNAYDDKDQQGVYSILSFDGKGSVPGTVDIKIGSQSASSSSSSVVSSSSSSSVVSSSSSSSSLSSSSSSSTGALQLVRNGRLYFISSDNSPANGTVNYDPEIRFNTNYSKTQKFKDGPVQLVFDQIKRKNDTNVDTGTCYFKLTKYTNDQSGSNVLATYTSAVSPQSDGGKCVVTFPVNDQNIHYYHVVAYVVDGNEKITDTNVLILYVGGGYVSIEPAVDCSTIPGAC